MKPFPALAVLIVLALHLTAGLTRAQTYSIAAFTIDGGGGTSSGNGSGGNFSLTGTLAQPDAHTASTGGPYAISGGFFAQYYALQADGAPRLIIRRNGPNCDLVWPSEVPGWVLQFSATDDLAPDTWTDVPGTPTVSGPDQFHTIVPTGPRGFFRLKKR